MKIAFCLSTIMVGSFLFGFYVLSYFVSVEPATKETIAKNYNITADRVLDSGQMSSKSDMKWGYHNDYCLFWKVYRNGSEINKDVGYCQF